ncbi:MAG: hypothetical protein ACNA77_06090 [Opitutales bacterium]
MTTNTGGKYCLNAFITCLPKHLLALALILSPVAALAQSGEDSFRGTWQVQTPEQGALVILLKNQGIASYFWGDNADRTVYQGSWSHADTIATVSWKDGSSHLLERTASGLRVTYRSTTGEGSYTAPAQQIPQEVLGQWAKPPTREDDMRSARDEAQGFFGVWKLADSENFIFVEPDRATASNMGDGAGQRGQWAKQGSELHIIWDSGQYGILRERERGFDYKQINSGEVIEDDETAPLPIARTIEANMPSAWMASYRAERKADSEGLAFSSRKVAREFYRGNWLVRRGENAFERIEMARFGGLKTSRDRSLGGQWTLSGQDAFLRWDDGVRQVLSPVGRGFILYAYRPGRPLDGVPTRIYAAAPADTTKLAEHLEGRKDVAKQVREMAEAAGINPASQEDIGWGRTFARWAWPFSDSSDGMTTEQMLEEEFEPETSSDPWWWPFWSEQPRQNKAEAGSPPESPNATETAPESATEAPLPLEMTETSELKQEAVPESNATVEEPDQEAPRPSSIPKRRSSKNWLWPF